MHMNNIVEYYGQSSWFVSFSIFNLQLYAHILRYRNMFFFFFQLVPKKYFGYTGFSPDSDNMRKKDNRGSKEWCLHFSLIYTVQNKRKHHQMVIVRIERFFTNIQPSE